MKNCKICGQLSGIYDVCRECEQDIKDGKVRKCMLCGEFYLANEQCSCQQTKYYKETSEETYEEDRDNNINVEVNNNSNEGGFGNSFKKGMGSGCGCFTAIAVILLILFAIAIASGAGVINSIF